MTFFFLYDFVFVVWLPLTKSASFKGVCTPDVPPGTSVPPTEKRKSIKHNCFSELSEFPRQSHK